MKQTHPRAGAGFTLIEVVLAIGISVGILVVALVFYQQSAQLRNQLLGETERLAAIRLAIDRITQDLRTVVVSAEQGFVGTAETVQFARSAALDLKSLGEARSGRSHVPASDLRLVSYRLLSTTEGTNMVVQGMERFEEPLLIGSRQAPREVSLSESNSPGQTVRSRVADTNALSLSTNQAWGEGLNASIRYLKLRYWNGASWVEEWNRATAPAGVEVTLSPEARRNAAAPAEMEESDQVFRRVVYLPAGRAGAAPGGGFL
ncbi:MAG: hypothetical protein FJ404_01465 [Verrucomicrobia bacterium]|nr:hypothetical protein [Verrucomicrobiota bacterium]